MPDFSKAFLRHTSERPLTIGQMYRKSGTTGEVGIELEFEGNKFQKDSDGLPAEWGYHKDGSLRGKDNAEYVLRRPVMFDKTDSVVTALWETLRAYGTKLDVSNRTSVHVHLNVQKFYANRLCAFVGLWFVFEELLTRWCGEHREGNLFCLRAKDAPAIVSNFKALFVENTAVSFAESMHYAGLNGNALRKFGSIEIRTMRGAVDPQEVRDWVGMLQRLYDASAAFPDPRAICDKFSGQSPVDFLNEVFGPYAPLLVESFGGDVPAITDSLYEGVRYAQDVCYCRDWGAMLDELKKPRDPFDSAGRGASQPRSAPAMAAAFATVVSPPSWLSEVPPQGSIFDPWSIQASVPGSWGEFQANADSMAAEAQNGENDIDSDPGGDDPEEWIPPEWYDDEDE